MIKSGLHHFHSTEWSSDLKNLEPLADSVANSLTRCASQVIESCDGLVPADLRGAAAGGAVRHVISRMSLLFPQSASAGTGHVDIMSACLDEKALAVDPVRRLHNCIHMLLQRFPGQHLLAQLEIICKRIIGVMA